MPCLGMHSFPTLHGIMEALIACPSQIGYGQCVETGRCHSERPANRSMINKSRTIFFMRYDQHLRRKVAVAAAAAFFMATIPAEAQQSCDTHAFNALIDETAQKLRNLNRDSETRFQERLHAIGKMQGWTEAQMASKASAAMDENKLANFNSQIEELVTQLDTLSATPASEVSCDRLNQLKSVRDQLISVMTKKAGFILAEVEASKPAQSAAVAAPAPLPPAKPEPPQPSVAPSAQAQKAPGAQPEKTDAAWSTSVAEALKRAGQKPPSTVAASSPAPEPAPAPSGAPLPLRPNSSSGNEKVASLPDPRFTPDVPAGPAAASYTVQEIRDAGKGVFGTLTSEFAGVVNYAFQKYGQPNAYIIGDEGGGAFLAGLRYGDGTLYSRLNGVEEPSARIYWQGPSVGLDLGATGSRVLFLVYNLDDLQTLYHRFPGIDGAAYVAGGFGLTVFRSGKTLIVPIRTGLGLRLGASVAYLKFTERARWNPF
jgi:hypothetical protein